MENFRPEISKMDGKNNINCIIEQCQISKELLSILRVKFHDSNVEY